MPDTPSTYAYDVFISYNHTSAEDKIWVQQELLPRLKKRKLSIYPAAKPGVPKLVAVETAIKASQHTLLVLTPDYFQNDWTTFEQLLAQTPDPTNQRLRLLPLIVRTCGLPDRLSYLVPIDFVQDEQPWQRLLDALPKPAPRSPIFSQPVVPTADDRLTRLNGLLADHSGFMLDRLRSFVGRAAELAEIRERIAAIQPEGGYVTITGQAGAGKSSVIAKLIESYGLGNVAFHFIPFNPGPDHQVGLLRNLMAQLILKYDLPDLYVASDSRAALRDYLPKVLRDMAEKGGQEVIFIDGLDQLEEDINGVRDLSFLPTNPPPGLVFVLGTRPNDTLKPLELLKPQYEYQLPNLSRADFDLVLEHRGVQLTQSLIERFYTAMQQNALYLDLVAQELATDSSTDPETLIQRIADDPGNLFSFMIGEEGRLTRWAQWREVGLPLLGILFAAAQPLGLSSLQQLVLAPGTLVKQGLLRLGGLVSRDGEGRYFLFHLKLQEYLGTHLFTTGETRAFHLELAGWANGEDSSIWESSADVTDEARRTYARSHYVLHLVEARAWERLWVVLDTGTYGQAKLRYDPSTRSYGQDVERGRRSAAKQGDLPRLWQYSLLRCSLASQIDSYPDSLFTLWAQLGELKHAVNLVEVLSHPTQQVRYC